MSKPDFVVVRAELLNDAEVFVAELGAMQYAEARATAERKTYLVLEVSSERRVVQLPQAATCLEVPAHD
ncbi:hypothetical protein [Lysobacter sp. CA196]|uniref:hypothetical protein n=1 Tax=Lysobacter sp. CA196 TaxID=3455606 RepID=UPI003F8D3B33